MSIVTDSITLNGVKIELVKGDITLQDDCEAIVNAANAQLKPGGGVAGAIHRAAGPVLGKETRPPAPISPGQSIITSGHHLPNRYIIHCLGTVYGRDTPEDKFLMKCYRNAMLLAEENKIKSIAFPAISTGAFGYPMDEAAEIAFKTIKSEIVDLKSIRLIRFVLWNENAYRIHTEVMHKTFAE
jgi:O-acetyl-ADP-ribose deacetylase (regulator of RNase III)